MKDASITTLGVTALGDQGVFGADIMSILIQYEQASEAPEPGSVTLTGGACFLAAAIFYKRRRLRRA